MLVNFIYRTQFYKKNTYLAVYISEGLRVLALNQGAHVLRVLRHDDDNLLDPIDPEQI